MKKVVYSLLFIAFFLLIGFVLNKYEWLGIFYNEKWNLASIEYEKEVVLQDYEKDSTFTFTPRLSSDRYTLRLYILGEESTSLDLEKILNGLSVNLNYNSGTDTKILGEYTIGAEENQYGIIINKMDPNSVVLLSNLTLKRGRKYELDVLIPSNQIQADSLPRFMLAFGIKHRVSL